MIIIGRQSHHGRREVFLSNHIDTLDSGCLYRQAYVFGPDKFRASDTIFDNSDGDNHKVTSSNTDDIYFSEYLYDSCWQRFRRIDLDNIDEDGVCVDCPTLQQLEMNTTTSIRVLDKRNNVKDTNDTNRSSDDSDDDDGDDDDGEKKKKKKKKTTTNRHDKNYGDNKHKHKKKYGRPMGDEFVTFAAGCDSDDEEEMLFETTANAKSNIANNSMQGRRFVKTKSAYDYDEDYRICDEDDNDHNYTMNNNTRKTTMAKKRKKLGGDYPMLQQDHNNSKYHFASRRLNVLRAFGSLQVPASHRMASSSNHKMSTLDIARKELTLASVPEQMPCREEERNKVMRFIEEALKSTQQKYNNNNNINRTATTDYADQNRKKQKRNGSGDRRRGSEYDFDDSDSDSDSDYNHDNNNVSRKGKRCNTTATAIGNGRCIYISGVPGTGKTATVLEVMRKLKRKVDDGRLAPFRFVEINSLKLPSPFHLYSTLWESMTGELLGPSRAAAKLEEKFESNSSGSNTPTNRYSVNENNDNDDSDNDDDDNDNNGRMIRKMKAKKEKNKKILKRKNNIHQVEEITTVLLVDEIDLLVTSQQTVLYSLFDWPSRVGGRNSTSNIIVIGIANTMDLPERMLPRVVSRLSSFGGLQRITFAPYTQIQLQKIIKSRLSSLDKNAHNKNSKDNRPTTSTTTGLAAFDSKSLEYASRKVAAISGDVRRALELCRRSVEMTIERGGKQQVTISDVNNAVRELSFSPHIAIITNAPFHQRLFLAACVMEMRFAGIATLSFASVANRLIDMCRTHGYFEHNNNHNNNNNDAAIENNNNGDNENGISQDHHNSETNTNGIKEKMSTGATTATVVPGTVMNGSIDNNNNSPELLLLPTTAQLGAVVSQLASNRLIVVEHIGNHNIQRIQLNVAVEDITYALKEDHVTWLRTFLG